MKKIGFIGYGLRSETMMKAFTGAGLPLAPAAVADPRLETLQPQLARDGRFADTRYYADAEEMLDREALDAVFIGTRCGLHARYAALVMERGLPLFLEKPVCIDEAQYARLLAAPPALRGRVMVSFPLHVTCIVQEMKRLVDSGALGDVVSVQAVNNVPYGGVYYHSWYRDAALTGGLFLQKSTHDIDYITHILGKRPVSVAALTSKMYFKGNKPAGLHCPDCPEYRTCPESSFVVEHRRKEEPSGELCCFARGHRKRRCGRGAVHLRRRHAHFIPSDISCKKRRRAAARALSAQEPARSLIFTQHSSVWTITTNAIPPSINFIIRKDWCTSAATRRWPAALRKCWKARPARLGWSTGSPAQPHVLQRGAQRRPTGRKPSNTASERRFSAAEAGAEQALGPRSIQNRVRGCCIQPPASRLLRRAAYTPQTGKRPMLFSIGRLLTSAAGGRRIYCFLYPHFGQTPFSFSAMPHSGQRSISFFVSNSALAAFTPLVKVSFAMFSLSFSRS